MRAGLQIEPQFAESLAPFKALAYGLFSGVGGGGGMVAALALTFSNSSLSRSIRVRSQTDLATTTPDPMRTTRVNNGIKNIIPSIRRRPPHLAKN